MIQIGIRKQGGIMIEMSDLTEGRYLKRKPYGDRWSLIRVDRVDIKSGMCWINYYKHDYEAKWTINQVLIEFSIDNVSSSKVWKALLDI
jgi:hypothetical protein